MRFFDWFLGKKPQKSKRPASPRVISGLDNDSPQVFIEMGGMTVLMTRDQYDYLYVGSNAPDPKQRDLDKLLPTVTRVRAIASGVHRGNALGKETIIDTSDPEALAFFRETLQIDEDPSKFGHCACLGGPTLELYSGTQLVATIGLQHGHAIRWNQWKHDAGLRDGKLLNEWLTRYGFVPEFLKKLLGNAYDSGGTMPLGFMRRGSSPLSPNEQRLRLVELSRVRAGDLDKALVNCQEVLNSEPDLAFGYAIRGLIHGQRQDHVRCIEDCTEAIRLGLNEAEIYFTRAVARDNYEQCQGALEDCTKALELDPGNVNIYNSRGLINTKLGYLDQAMADLNEAVRLAPLWGLPYLNRGKAHIARNDLDAAIADYEIVIGLLDREGSQVDHKTAAVACGNRAQVYRMKGDEVRAVAGFQEAERLYNNPPRQRFSKPKESFVGNKPCPKCGKPLRSNLAQQCFECGAKWHEAPSP